LRLEPALSEVEGVGTLTFISLNHEVKIPHSSVAKYTTFRAVKLMDK